ncbi:MAG: SprT family zinc-dependent metalloprotease [Anaerolineales bacterium]|jgi:predicted metal-dependent hydrolase
MTGPYQLIRSRRRTIALIVREDGSLVVRAPLHSAEEDIRTFVESKAAWIRRTQARVDESLRARIKKFEPGEQFWYLGKTYPLVIVPPSRSALVWDSAFHLSSSSRANAERVFIYWYKAEAARILSERVSWYAEQGGFAYRRIRITSARTRWGSCSPDGTLCFSYRLVMAPQEAIDYVAVHELVHLKLKNHARAFWTQVEAIMPDYRPRLDWLNRNGRFLGIGK